LFKTCINPATATLQQSLGYTSKVSKNKFEIQQ